MASRKLFPVRFEISPGDIAATPKTRFRFIQRSFTAARDGWALDNVRILRYLPDDWAAGRIPLPMLIHTKCDAARAMLL